MKIAVPFALVMSGGLALLVTAPTSVNAQSNNPPVVASVAPQAVPAEPVEPKDLSKGAKDVIKLFRDGKKENVLIFYAKYSDLDYKLSADDIIYFKAIGVSANVISAMMESDTDRQKALAVRMDDDRFATTITAPASATVDATPVVARATVAQQSPPATTEEPQMTPTVVYPDYSAYPNYYETFDNDTHSHFIQPTITVGIGVGVGFGGGFDRGYYGRGGHFGGRR
jgi:hypothetical protein